MAASSSGRVKPPHQNKTILNLSESVNDRQIGTANDSRSNLLTDVLNCENSMDNDDFAALFTSQTVSTPYEEGHPNMLSNFVSQTSPVLADNEYHTAVDTIDIENLDTQLQNLPKECYMTKLLDLCSNDETLICWYRNALCSRAKTLPDCPPGKLLSRKSTKGGSSITKYAKDCYILYMFLMGDKSCVSEIFDKNKSSSYVSDLNKINAVEIKTTIQLLVQKVASLENLVNSKDKTIVSLTSDFNTLKSDFEQLQSDHDRLKGESMSRFTKYDAFQKLTSDNFKILDTEKMEYQMDKTKTNEELKRLSKVSTNFQKQISALSPSKTYASTIKDTIKNRRGSNVSISESCRGSEQADDPSLTTSPATSLDRTQQIIAEKVHELRESVVTPPKTFCSSRSQVDSTQIISSPLCTSTRSTLGDSRYNGSAPSRFTNSEVLRSRSLCPEEKRTLEKDSTVNESRGKPDFRSVEYDGKSCVVTLDDKQKSKIPAKHEENIFIGVTYRKTARYYLSGIDKKSTKSGIANFIECKGVKTTHLMLFTPKYYRSRLSAKVNIPLEFVKTVEAPDFWPEGVRCRRWMSNREWEEKCANQLDKEDWDTDVHDNY